MKENQYTLKDVKKMLSPISKRNKKLEIEKRNLLASIKIRAHNKIMQANKKKEIDDFKNSLSQQLKAGIIPADAYEEFFDKRIGVIQSRRDELKLRKEENGGTLSAGAENQLKMYEDELTKLINDKEEFLKEHVKKDAAEPQVPA